MEDDHMEYVSIPGIDMKASRIGLGTWAIGGFWWGGPDDDNALRTIQAALDSGINFIDTAPVYGIGHSEELVGQAVAAYGKRDKVIIATKFGLNVNAEGGRRDSRPEFIREELENSLKRLQMDYIDLYQVHWPDTLTPFEETAAALVDLQKEGKIRAIGVSNFSTKQMDGFRAGAMISTLQPPYNIFEQEAGVELLPYAEANNIAVLAYGSLCRGLLSGRMTPNTVFGADDLRGGADPNFQAGRFEQYLEAVAELDKLAKAKFGKTVMQLAIRWVLDEGVEVALVGARRPEQLEPLPGVMGWSIDAETKREIASIVSAKIKDPCQPDFMAPPEQPWKNPA